jgi:uncharacterized protein YbaR (Trm112 family)
MIGGMALKLRLMDILACPICKSHPLNLYVFEEKDEIVDGLLVCNSCNRWYPIIEEIPHMLPDELRDGKDDLPFMKKWKEKFPEATLKDGKPFNEKNL